jgi:hypothetical protein
VVEEFKKVLPEEVRAVSIKKSLPEPEEETGLVMYKSMGSTGTLKAAKTMVEENQSLSPSMEEMKLINEFSVVPQEAHQWMVLRNINVLGLGNEVDVQGDKFSKDAEQDIVDGGPATPVLMDHSHNLNNLPPLGICLSSRMTKEGPRETWGIPLEDYHAPLIKGIKNGTVRSISVGILVDPNHKVCSSCNMSIYSYACPHEPGQVDESGKPVSVTINKVARYLERSVVNVPARMKTAIKSLQQKALEDKATISPPNGGGVTDPEAYRDEPEDNAHECDNAPEAAMMKAKKPYGDVEYADPGYQEDKKPRYPIDTEEHIRAAWNYIHQERNSSEYSSEELSHIKSKIKAAWKREIDSSGPPEQKSLTESINKTLYPDFLKSEFEFSVVKALISNPGLYKGLPLVQVRPEQVKPTQSAVDAEKVAQFVKEGNFDGGMTISRNGDIYMIDGHHRLEAAKSAERPTIWTHNMELPEGAVNSYEAFGTLLNVHASSLRDNLTQNKSSATIINVNTIQDSKSVAKEEKDAVKLNPGSGDADPSKYEDVSTKASAEEDECMKSEEDDECVKAHKEPDGDEGVGGEDRDGDNDTKKITNEDSDPTSVKLGKSEDKDPTSVKLGKSVEASLSPETNLTIKSLVASNKEAVEKVNKLVAAVEAQKSIQADQSKLIGELAKMVESISKAVEAAASTSAEELVEKVLEIQNKAVEVNKATQPANTLDSFIMANWAQQ